MQHDIREEIKRLKRQMGEDLCILAHHYQQDAVVEHADYVGDSLELAQTIGRVGATHIIMCGVFFMAQSSAILAQDTQKVYTPYTKAGCTLADIAPAYMVEEVLRSLNAFHEVIPLAYVNTSAEIKAICGRYGGSVCTSANSTQMLQWALSQGEAVLFLPDKNLAFNTAREIGLSRGEISLLERGPKKGIRLYVWPGLCDVHVNFRKEHILHIREMAPKARIIVHPECPPEVVELADAAGSTSKIIKYVTQAPEGSTIYIGTEIHMVNRLRQRFKGKKEILPLFECSCRFMDMITPLKLYRLLKNIDEAWVVEIGEDIKKDAQLALNRMLEVCNS